MHSPGDARGRLWRVCRQACRAWSSRRPGVLVVIVMVAAVCAAHGEVGERSDGDEYDVSDEPDAARVIAEAAHVLEVALSPRADAVAYAVARGSVETNQYVVDLLLQRLDAQRRPIGARQRLDRRVSETGREEFKPRWCPKPKTECLTFFTKAELGQTPTRSLDHDDIDARTIDIGSHPTAGQPRLVKYDLDTERFSLVTLREQRDSEAPSAGAESTRTVGNDYQWSPSGRFIGFTRDVVPARRLDPRRGTPASLSSWQGQGGRSALFVLDMSSGLVEQLSPSTLHIMSFDWAPDERTVVVSAVADTEGVPILRTDLFLIDRQTRHVRPLVVQPGTDSEPTWSPDGKWIAFTSQLGEPTYYSGGAAVVPATGGDVMRLAGADDPQLWSHTPTPICWTPDSRAFYYASANRMNMQVIKADVTTRQIGSVLGLEHWYDNQFSFSADRATVAFTRESPIVPQDLFVGTLAGDPPQQITRLDEGRRQPIGVRVDRVEYPSRDGKFTIQALLLTPRDAWVGTGRDARIATPLRTVVYVNGGPGMLHAKFLNDGHRGAMLPLAMRGYAVLAPDTRGRNGYGQAFRRGMRDGASAGRLPYEDLMAGVDDLVRRGIADPASLGISGHSYGGYLTSYVTTQTARFSAAVVHEAHVLEWLTEALISGEDMQLLRRDLYGIRNVFDKAERQRLIDESPGFNMDRVSTPTLLIFGERGTAGRIGWPLFGALQQRHIPSELIVYDEGHAFARPAGIADDVRRTTAWFDYWLRDVPYPDPDRQRAYDTWQREHR